MQLVRCSRSLTSLDSTAVTVLRSENNFGLLQPLELSPLDDRGSQGFVWWSIILHVYQHNEPIQDMVNQSVIPSFVIPWKLKNNLSQSLELFELHTCTLNSLTY